MPYFTAGAGGRLTEALRESFRLREQRRKDAIEASFTACIAILKDPDSTTWEKFRAMAMLDNMGQFGPRGRKLGSPRRKEKPKPQPKVPELSKDFVDQVMATAQREINGHQSEA